MVYKVHPLADVASTNIGKDTLIWQFCVVLQGAKIGDNCNINCNCFIENKVIIGNNVTIKSGVQIWDGITIEDNVFVGPNVTFTNDIYPRSKAHREEYAKTHICEGASIGANSTILSGITIGQFALIGAGSMVTKSVPPFTLWYGNPAKQTGYITKDAIVLDSNMIDKKTGIGYKMINNNLEQA